MNINGKQVRDTGGRPFRPLNEEDAAQAREYLTTGRLPNDAKQANRLKSIFAGKDVRFVYNPAAL